jgi:hypothetical protein
MTTTSKIITYGEGGFDESKPENNVVLIVEQDVDESTGDAIGLPREIFRAPGFRA